MSNTAKTILMIVVGVALLAIGILVGMSLKTGKPATVANTSCQAANTSASNAQPVNPVSPLSSGVISSVFAFGKLDSVAGQKINVSSGVDVITVTTNSNTKIVSYEQSGKDAKGNVSVIPKNITLKDLKIGDYLNINLKVSNSGELVAASINRVVLPPPEAK